MTLGRFVCKTWKFATRSRSMLKSILQSHFHLLCHMIRDGPAIAPNLGDYEYIFDGENHRASHLNKTDLREGHIVCRMVNPITNTIQIKNIRDLIESMSLPNIEKYNVGLGAATTRTMKQKRMAQLYTDKVLNRLQMP
eukprot:812806_1